MSEWGVRGRAGRAALGTTEANCVADVRNAPSGPKGKGCEVWRFRLIRYFLGEQILNPRAAAVEISKPEFDKVLNAKHVVMAMISLEVKYNIIVECYRRLEFEMFEIGFDRSMENDFSRKVSSKIVIRLNQHLLSFLTAVRAYHDQRPQDLAAFSTAVSPWVKNAEGVFRRIFDLIFEYRVMEAVRNHAQHHRLPTTKFHMGASQHATEKGVSTLRYTLDPEIDLNEVANNVKLSKKIRDEIKNLGVEWIDLKLAVRRYVSGLVRGHNEIRLMLFDVFAEAKQVYAESADRYKSSSVLANDALFVMAYSEPESCKPIYLGADVIAEAERMSKLHPSATNLSTRYVSTEVVRLHPNHPPTPT